MIPLRLFINLYVLSIKKCIPPKQNNKGLLEPTVYCQNCILNYSWIVQSLYKKLKQDQLNNLHLNLEKEAEFKTLKQLPTKPIPKGTQSITFPFFIPQKEGNALGLLTQKHGERYVPLEYFSPQLDPVARRHPHCLRVISVSMILQKNSLLENYLR